MDTSDNASGTPRGPLSRTWPQIFKKRRRVSPSRDVSEQNQNQNVGVPPPPFKLPIPKPGRQSISVASDSASTSTGSTQADLLASKSNYEWIAEGRHTEMGLHFSTAMATGVMMRRATHRAAEQARRDRMKSAMVDLAEFLLDGEVTFGSGTSCFVVSRGEERGEDGENGGEKKGRNINKARIMEMALERLKSQEREIEGLVERLKDCQCAMDTTE